MPYQDVLNEKRTLASQTADTEARDQRLLATTIAASRQVAAAISTEAEKSRSHVQPVTVMNDTLAQRQDVQAVVSGILALKDLSSTEFSTLSTAITQALQYVAAENSNTNAQTADIIRQSSAYVTDNLASLERTSKSGTEAVVSTLQSVITALQKPEKELPAPIVNVEPAHVTVQEREVDLQPLLSAIESLKQPDTAKIDLSDYRASDIKDSGKDMQYIGFVHPSGKWYIIENDIRKDSMRYLFGSKGYTTHFKSAASYEYKVLDKAYNATV